MNGGAFQAVCFDLDGTLVETEALKARSYALAAEELRPGEVHAADVAAAYDDMVGRPREEVVSALVRRFDLEEPARRRMADLGAESPGAVFAALRLRHYEAMIADRELVKRQEYTHAVALLRRVRRDRYRTGLATMSHAAQAFVVMDVLRVRALLDVVVTRDDVTHPKPDPEIYWLLARRMGVPSSACLVIEDSVPGIRSALAAGMTCVAATTAMTRGTVHAAGLLPPELVVDQPERLESVVLPLLAGRARAPA